MPRRANRVGVEIDSRLHKGEEEPHGDSNGESSTARGMASVGSTQSLEDAKAQRQKELLRKKKVERRAHAKLRAAEKQQRQEEKQQKRELRHMIDEDVPAPEPTRDRHTIGDSSSLVCVQDEHEAEGVNTTELDLPVTGANSGPVPCLETEQKLQQPSEQTVDKMTSENEYPCTAEILPKNAQQPSQPHAAALTIQKALKKKFKKCKTMFRKSPRVFAEDVIAPLSSNFAEVVDLPPTCDMNVGALEESNFEVKPPEETRVHEPPVERLADAMSQCEDFTPRGPFVPPLLLQCPSPSRPQSRRRSSTSSCSCSDSASSSYSSYSCSCSCSSSESETDTYRRSSHRSRTARSSETHRRKSRHHSARQRSQRSSGPSCSLLPGLASGEESMKYGEVHHFMATRIQSSVRGYRGRVRARRRQTELDQELRDEALLELQQEACLKIQSRTRGVLVRKKIPISDGERRRRRRRRSQDHDNNATTPRSEEGGGSPERGIYTDPDEVGEWPQEIDLELQDEWQDLNQLAVMLDGSVTHSQFISQGRLRVFCGTWNMHAKKPTDDLRLWVRLNRYHIVAVGSEECVNSIAKSVVFTSKKSWEDQLRGTLGEEYVLVASHALTAIHNIVFVHTSILPLLGNIQSDAVATGLGNQLGNKGGVGISFTVGTTSFAFVNSHFDAHQRNVSKRNGNFHRINHELRLSPTGAISSPTNSVAVAPTPGKPNIENLQGLGRTSANRFSMPTVTGGATAGSKRTISEQFDRVFWYGDLNYRINGTRRMVDTLLLRNQHDVLYANDQLQREMKAGNVFVHYQEGRLHFRPTYKFDKRSDVYDSSSKQRIPSWTDRVLYLSNGKVRDIELLSYRSQTNFRTSDHRPVCAIFQVNFTVAGTAGSLESPRRSISSHEGGENHAISQACAIQ